jgi:hypothetical protein
MLRSSSFSLPAAFAFLAATALPAFAQAGAVSSAVPSLDERGEIDVSGHSAHYLIRNLPVSSFPELPPAIASALTGRGCVIPQTYEAKRPENVIHGSFERPGSADWAVLCSAGGKVSLLVFLTSGSSDTPTILASKRTLTLLQTHDSTGVLGFDWGIDPASPKRVHDAQAGLAHRPPAPDHDCVAGTEIDRRTIYHLYRDGAWETVPTE